MSQEQLQAFISQARGNTNLQIELNKASDVMTVAAIAQEAGLTLSLDNDVLELTARDLESAAGGTLTLSTNTCGNQTCNYTCGATCTPNTCKGTPNACGG